MPRAFFYLLALLCALSCCGASGQSAASAAAPQQDFYTSYYVSTGNSLQLVNGNPDGANYAEWQVWLYPWSVRISRSGSGLKYTRWGALQGPTARAVMSQLVDYQQFERAYVSFFGADTWGRFTFAYPIGPIAVAEQGPMDDPHGLLWKIGLLNQRLESAVVELHLSLVNGEGAEPPPRVQQPFEQLRNSMQGAARFYDELSRFPGKYNYLDEVLARLAPGVNQLDSAIPEVTAMLPTVKLPAGRDWMKHSENGGSDGTIDVTVQEIGSSAWVEQEWTGGDGSMAGTKIITIVPYQDIGALDVWTPRFGDDRKWSVRIQAADANGFPQSVTSPQRASVKRTYKAVDLKTSVASIFLDFSNARDAQDAYAFFLYHKERGL